MGPGGFYGQILQFLRFWEGLVIYIYNSISIPNYRDGTSLKLWVYTKNVSSAWPEVSLGTWPSTASITAPEGRYLGDF